MKKNAYPFGMGSVSLRIRANGHTGLTRVTRKEGKEYSATRRDVQQRDEEYPNEIRQAPHNAASERYRGPRG